MKAFLSIIVPVYNSERTIRRCIDSILNQTFINWELLLIDDGSIDCSASICNEYVLLDSRIKYFYKKNGGVSSARNFGLEKASGEWIAFVDADDYICLNMYELLFLKVSKDVDLVVCDFLMDYGKNKKIFKTSPISNGKYEFIRYEIIYGWTSVVNMIIRHSLIKENNLKFDRIRYSEDLIFFVKVVCFARNLAKIDSPLYYYDRTNEKSALHNFYFYAYKDLIYCETEIINFFKQQRILPEFKREMYWRILRDKQELVLNTTFHQEFLNLYPEAHRYILSSPLLNKKMKIMMWLLTHKMGVLVKLIIFARSLKK